MHRPATGRMRPVEGPRMRGPFPARRPSVSVFLEGGEFRLEEGPMAGVQALDFSSPDETRTPAKTQADVVRVGGTTVARLQMEPGWTWAECIKPVAGTD